MWLAEVKAKAKRHNQILFSKQLLAKSLLLGIHLIVNSFR